MKTQIITDLCEAITSLNIVDHAPEMEYLGYTSNGDQAKRLTKHMVEIAKDLRKDRNVNLGKLNTALKKAGWDDKEFVIVKTHMGSCWWNDLKLVDKLKANKT